MAKILLVDDAAFMRMMVKNVLTENGYTDLQEASDGAEAVAKYNEIRPDLVIMDITMPNKDGLEALKEIRASDPNASVVMCSAMGQEAMVIEAIKSGAKDFIVSRIVSSKRSRRSSDSRKDDGRRLAFFCMDAVVRGGGSVSGLLVHQAGRYERSHMGGTGQSYAGVGQDVARTG